MLPTLSHSNSPWKTILCGMNNYSLLPKAKTWLDFSQVKQRNQPCTKTTLQTLIIETKTLSDEYLKWCKEDRLLRGWIIGTLTEEAVGLVIGLESSQLVWNALKEAYAQDSQEQDFTLRQQLTYLRKDPNQSLAKHLRKFMSIFHSLSATGNTLLANLGQKYEYFTTKMLIPSMPSYSKAVSLL